MEAADKDNRHRIKPQKIYKYFKDTLNKIVFSQDWTI